MSDEIINLEKMNNIYVSKDGEIRAWANMEDCVYVLGKYESEERAKEVLQEIINTYLDCNEENIYEKFAYVKNKVYEMPIN